jgi:hypothetical protein
MQETKTQIGIIYSDGNRKWMAASEPTFVSASALARRGEMPEPWQREINADIAKHPENY